MLKELVLAIVFGTILGFGLTGSVVGIKNLFQKDTKKPIITIPTAGPSQSLTITLPSNTPTPVSNSGDPAIEEDKISITKPENDSVSASEEITINGQALPKSLVLATTLSDKSQVIADENGEFSLKLKLDAGRNEIQVFAFTSEKELSTKLFVTYSNARF